MNGIGMEHVGCLQVFDGLRDIGPGRILREDGTGHDLEPSIGRPPGLRAVLLEQYLVDLAHLSGMTNVPAEGMGFNRRHDTVARPGWRSTRVARQDVTYPANEVDQTGCGSVG